MNEQEFEQLQRRFGADVSLWPAPYRQEAMRRDAADTVDADDALDRLVLEAVGSPTDDITLTRKVLATINVERKPGAFGGFARVWPMPAAASGFAALLLLAALGGYMAANDTPEGLDDALLALTLGGDGGGVFDELDSGDGEEQL
ncbi:hypothetical protein ABMA32_01860 [Mesorhizobium sp. VNQ89]|uniref:hypothetical protein n=1 Tax=Mesorhizobium quangtriensis TaxID=3157709 RepID=UPI0032B881D7